jgi:hypothetical protein
MASSPHDDGNKMFPFFRVSWCTSIVKEAAKAYGWNDMLDWCNWCSWFFNKYWFYRTDRLDWYNWFNRKYWSNWCYRIYWVNW